jgi:hypothetical protein
MIYQAIVYIPGVKKTKPRIYANVKGDLVYETKSGAPLPVRVLILDDETRVEIPMSWLIEFSPARFTSIHSQMEKDAGQKIPV